MVGGIKTISDFDRQLPGQYAMIHRLQPACLLQTTTTKCLCAKISKYSTRLTGWKYGVGLSGQAISSLPLKTCETMNGMWGYKITDQDYKSAKTLIHYLVVAQGCQSAGWTRASARRWTSGCGIESSGRSRANGWDSMRIHLRTRGSYCPTPLGSDHPVVKQTVCTYSWLAGQSPSYLGRGKGKSNPLYWQSFHAQKCKNGIKGTYPIFRQILIWL